MAWVSLAPCTLNSKPNEQEYKRQWADGRLAPVYEATSLLTCGGLGWSRVPTLNHCMSSPIQNSNNFMTVIQAATWLLHLDLGLDANVCCTWFCCNVQTVCVCLSPEPAETICGTDNFSSLNIYSQNTLNTYTNELCTSRLISSQAYQVIIDAWLNLIIGLWLPSDSLLRQHLIKFNLFKVIDIQSFIAVEFTIIN